MQLQKFVLALYDRLEQLESENDLLKSEILSISNKFKNSEDSNNKRSSQNSSNQKQLKSRKDRVERETPRKLFDPIKILAANIRSADFDYQSVQEKDRIISAMDEETAVETISWAILNSGRIPQLQREIEF